MNKLILNGDDWLVSGWIKHQWRLGQSMELAAAFNPPVQELKAQVPGAVQLDLMKAGYLASPDYGLDSLAGEWVNNREWIFRKEFRIPVNIRGEKVILCFDGLDYWGEISLNGQKIGTFCGMFIPVEIDITGIVRWNDANQLAVVFYQTPEVDGQYGYSNRIKILKSRFNYTWDWCPRIIPVGIWDDVYLKIYNYADIIDFFPQAKVSEDGITGKITAGMHVKADVSGDYEFCFKVFHAGAMIKSSAETKTLTASSHYFEKDITVEDIQLWWSAGLGEQPVYEVEAVIIKDGVLCSQISKRVGFRTVLFEHNHRSPEGALPYTMLINGRRVFIKGVNWVPVSPFYGSVTREQYENHLKRFVDMGCNLLRVWGGAILEKKDFYDLCDEMGIMVWQEFPQSSSGINNTPPEDPDFLKELEKTARVFISRRRHHPSHVIWCGGNELMWETWRPVDRNHANIKILEELVTEMDPGKYFLPASASGPRFTSDEKEYGKGVHHDVHGPWNYVGEQGHYRFFNGDDSLFRSETGCPGISRIETLNKYKKDLSLWPPDKTNPYWMHRGAWWIQRKQLSDLFGDWSDEGQDIKKYVQASRYVQAEALRYAAEAMRRREPEASGLIFWMGNEPFPNNSNTSLIECDGTPKPAYYWVREAFSSLHASIKYEKINYATGEDFKGQVYINCESECNKSIHIGADIFNVKGRLLHQVSWKSVCRYPVSKAGLLDWQVKDCDCHIFLVRLCVRDAGGSAISVKTYLFTIGGDQPFAHLRTLPDCQVSFEMRPDEGKNTAILHNKSDIAAIGVFVYGKDPSDFVNAFPNYLIMLPGEKREVRVTARKGAAVEENTFMIEAFNME